MSGEDRLKSRIIVRTGISARDLLERGLERLYTPVYEPLGPAARIALDAPGKVRENTRTPEQVPLLASRSTAEANTFRRVFLATHTRPHGTLAHVRIAIEAQARCGTAAVSCVFLFLFRARRCGLIRTKVLVYAGCYPPCT